MLLKSHYDAMEFKYQGFTYPEIAKRIKLKTVTITKWFGRDGLLEVEYETYARTQNRERITQAVELFKQNAELASKTLNRILTRAVAVIDRNEAIFNENVAEKKSAQIIEDSERKLRSAEHRAADLAQIVLDRAGLPVITKAEITPPISPKDEKEAIYERLARSGIDPTSIRYISSAPRRSN